jgi:ABC-type bacteriocin/lantibiotic exporter with double-glycine peptidase domain
VAPFKRRRVFATEVIQTSAMDCGPATLKALLDGFRIPVSYGRLREACQTDVDGTSIDTLEEIAGQLGLDAQQILVPLDHVLLSEAEALPAIAVVRNASGVAHFVVAWRKHGPLVQVMDPARGRLWMARQTFLDKMVVHSMTVSAPAWREWAGSDAFLKPLRRRLRAVGLPRQDCDRRIANAVADPSWRELAALDAAARMIASLQSAGAVKRRNASAVLTGLTSRTGDHLPSSAIADQYWSVWSTSADDEHAEVLNLRGAVLVKVNARPAQRPLNTAATEPGPAIKPALSPELAAALAEPPAKPLRHLIGALKSDGILGPTIAAAALAIAAAGVVFEAILLRSALDIGSLLRAPEQGLWAGAVLVVFAAALLGTELVLASAERRMGSHLEGRLRVAFLDKIPRLADAYFQSRPVADMLERSHTVHILRMLPRLGVRFVRVGLELFITAIALAWLSPETAVVALVAAIAAAGIPLLGQSVVGERDLRARTHTGALARFHLDALLGRTAIEAHGAAATIEREHEGLLAEWASAVLALQRASMTVEGFQMLVGFGLVAWTLLGHFGVTGGTGLLLQIYWLLNLPALGYELALIAREYPAYRSTILRVLEPLGAPDFRKTQGSTVVAQTRATGVRIQAHDVSVRAAGHGILDEINLEIPPGSHVAVVGASGAGKSTLVGLLLGWQRAVSGDFLVDGEPLTTERLDALRHVTAWVDPTVQIWNRSLLENLVYGSGSTDGVGTVLEMAGLLPVVAKLPQGLATFLGEGGALLSAGEAQRVRLARAMLRKAPRLVLLDEPFLGLERDRRRTLLTHARQRWVGSTLLYVTHDVVETRAFDRVLVLDHGRLVEDGEPLQLAQTPSSRYRRLLQAQESLQSRIAASGEWKRIRLESGRIVNDHVRSSEQTA